jgi:hypothetical protein
MRTQVAASRQATMPRLALNRKDTRNDTMVVDGQMGP